MHVRALNIEQSLHRLADYPVLAALVQGQTTATKLDGRACRFLYQAALHEIDISKFSTRERQFFDALGLVKKC